jgi:peptidoglycan-N-acetylmuramic acid deacetylase
MGKFLKRLAVLIFSTLLISTLFSQTSFAIASAPPQIKTLPKSNMVCLTFDDGFSKASIIKILDCLRANKVNCTFFIIGSCLKKYPDLWRQAIADGNEICYHTMNHSSLNSKSNKQILNDIKRWNTLAHQILGADYKIPKIARAPGGNANSRVRKLFQSQGYSLIYWSSDTFTGVYRSNHKNVAKRISNYIISRTKVGSISLQHFNCYDAPSVCLYIQKLKNKFTLGKISDALLASAIK